VRIGNIRVEGQFQADTWQRVYSNTLTAAATSVTIVGSSGITQLSAPVGDDIHWSNGDDAVAQGFKTKTAEPIKAFVLRLKYATSISGTLTAYIYSDNAGVPNAAVATFSSMAASGLTTSYVDYFFTGTFTPVVGTQYHLVLIWTSGSAGDVLWAAADNNNPYADGGLTWRESAVWQTNLRATWDLYFMISTLDGDTAEEYILRTRIVAATTSTEYFVRMNNDSGSNYGHQQLYAQDTSVSAQRGTTDTFISIGYNGSVGDVSPANTSIYAKSGYLRTALVNKAYRIATTSVNLIDLLGASWNNTSDNITSMVVSADTAGGLGIGTVVELYAKRSKI